MPVGEDSPISQSKQDKIDRIMDNLKQEVEFQPPEVQSMINALQGDNIDGLVNTVNGFAKTVKDDIAKLVDRYDEVKESISDVFAVAGLKYFDSNLENPYTSTMNNFYASVASDFFQTSAFQDSPEINNMMDFYNVAANMDMCFKDCLKKTFDINVEPSPLEYEQTAGVLGEYNYRDNTLLLKWANVDSDEMFNTIFHELTHKVQYALVDNFSTSPSLANYKNYIDMLKYNFLIYYTRPDYKYVYQPLELEAHRNGDTFKELYALAQGYGEDKDNIFDANDIKASFLNVQKKINDDGHYSLNDNSNESERYDYSDSDSDSDSSFDETLHISYNESPEMTNFAPNDYPPFVDRSTKPKMTPPDVLPRQPLEVTTKSTTLGDALDLIGFVKSVGKEWDSLSLQEKADLVDFGLLKSSYLDNANSEIGYMIKQQTNKLIFAPFGDMLTNNDSQVSSYKTLLNDVSMSAAENLAFDSEMKNLLTKNYGLLSNLKPLFEQMADKWSNSINSVGISTETPLCKNSTCADTVSFNHKTNELTIPVTYSGDFSFIADEKKALQSALEVGFHELTHKFQQAVIENKDSLETDIANVARILEANGKYYFDGSNEYDISLYKKQALEAEAYDNAKKTLYSFNDAKSGNLETYGVASWDDLKNGDSYSSSDDE